MSWQEEFELDSVSYTEKELDYFVREDFLEFLRETEKEGVSLTKTASSFNFENFTKTDSFTLYQESDIIDEILITKTDGYILKLFNEQRG